MQMVLVMCAIFVSKLLNNAKIGIGWKNMAGIPKFVIQLSVGVCGEDMEVVWKCALYFLRKLLNNTKIGIGWRNKAVIPKFVI